YYTSPICWRNAPPALLGDAARRSSRPPASSFLFALSGPAPRPSSSHKRSIVVRDLAQTRARLAAPDTLTESYVPPPPTVSAAFWRELVSRSNSAIAAVPPAFDLRYLLPSQSRADRLPPPN